jgi:hypothetical protein
LKKSVAIAVAGSLALAGTAVAKVPRDIRARATVAQNVLVFNTLQQPGVKSAKAPRKPKCVMVGPGNTDTWTCHLRARGYNAKGKYILHCFDPNWRVAVGGSQEALETICKTP